jgi:sulfur carrier protein ThiS
VDFESTAIPGYATSALSCRFGATVISMVFRGCDMEVRFNDGESEHLAEVEPGATVREALLVAGLLPSMVIVSYEGAVIPHSTPLNGQVVLRVTTISSGG